MQETDWVPAKPMVRDPKSAWVDWAVTHGMDRDEATATSKAQLIATFGD